MELALFGVKRWLKTVGSIADCTPVVPPQNGADVGHYCGLVSEA
jgi:hypothetical protein